MSKLLEFGVRENWTISGGINIPIAKSWNLIPEVRYRALSRDIKTNIGKTSVVLNYISTGLGISFAF